MEIRQATAKEIEFLRSMEALSYVPMETAFVAFEGGKLIGALPVFRMWQLEPLEMFHVEHRVQGSRAALMLYQAAEEFVQQSDTTRLFVTTRSPEVIGWSDRLGWKRIYDGAAMFLKFFPPRET